MHLSVGYQLAEAGEESFVETVREFRAAVTEVYFPWVGAPSGRPPIGRTGTPLDLHAVKQLESDLVAMRALGVRLNLLLNANCYGARAISRDLEREVIARLSRLDTLVGGIETVTTASPAIAFIVKQHRPEVEVRASVNMRIGTVEGMQYLAEVFDSYCVSRDVNRDLDQWRRLKRWADGAGKRLHLLVNSGCLRHCSGQTFHDNLVAHEADGARLDPLPGFVPTVCWRLLRDPANWRLVLQGTWIRLEDLGVYEGLVAQVKLATRLHERPHVVIGAYARGRYDGNLLDLLEPGYGPAFAPYVLDNRRFPADWFLRTSTCDRHCEECTTCAEVLKQVLRPLAV